MIFNKEKTKLCTVIGNEESYVIPYGVIEIGGHAFHNKNKMKTITIPNTVTTIGISFNYCTSLTSIEIPSSVTSISVECFANSPNITEIIIHKKLGSISDSPWGCVYGDKAIKWDS